MNNLMEEDEDNCCDNDKTVENDKSYPNGNHPSSENDLFFSDEEKARNEINIANINNSLVTKKHEQPQSLLINCLSDLKTETCI